MTMQTKMPSDDLAPIVAVVMAAVRYRRARARVDKATSRHILPANEVSKLVDAEEALIRIVDKLPNELLMENEQSRV